MRWNRNLWLLLPLLAIQPVAAEVPSSEKINRNPTPDSFSVCHGYGCREVEQIGLTVAQWQEIQAIFEPAPESPEQERRAIARAIARFEQRVGPLTGTQNDKGRTFGATPGLDQMDCIDESSNSTSYLQILQQAGLLRWHQVSDRVSRGFFLFGWPHTTAVISERDAPERKWVVDSWFHPNGDEPEIVPLEIWKSGWEPQK